MPAPKITLLATVLLTGALLGAGMPPARIPAEVPAGVPVVFEPVWASPPPGESPPAAELILSREGEEPRRLPLPVPLAGRAPATVLLPAGTVWSATVEGEGLWSPRLMVEARPGIAPRVLPLHPTGILRGRVTVPRGETPPSEITLRLAPTPGISPPGPSLPAAEIPCPLTPVAARGPRPENADTEGQIHCPVPAGLLDLRGAVPGYAPVYLWSVALAAGSERDLGTLALVAGGSVSGRIRLSEGADPSSFRVSLLPRTEGRPADLVTAKRLEAMALTAPISERGFFQFTGVPPGHYLVRLTHPDFAPIDEIVPEVEGDREIEIPGTFTPSPLSRLAVGIDPPRTPDGQPWSLRLDHRDGPLPEPYRGTVEGETSGDGLWTAVALVPSTYVLSVEGPDGSRWATEDVEVRGPEEAVFVEIPLLRVRGTVEMGGEGVAGTLLFGGRSGYRRVAFALDEEGAFAGLLPEGGLWPLALSIRGQEGVRLALEPVEVTVPRGRSEAVLAIEVPNTLLVGEVIDEAGHPVPGAAIQISSSKTRTLSDLRSDEEGRFEVRGLIPGLLTLHAEEGERTSDHTLVPLSEEGEAPYQTLVLLPRLALSGRVSTAGGVGVVGARILAWPELTASPGGTLLPATSGPGGLFELAVRVTDGALNLLVAAPGHAIRLLRVPVDPGRLIEVPVEREAGTLVLHLPEVPSTPELGVRPASFRYFLVHGGTFLPVDFLRFLVRSQQQNPVPGGRIELANLEVGEYQLCQGGLGALREGQGPSRQACAAGFLLPGSELVLRSPGSRDGAGQPASGPRWRRERP